MANRNKKHVWVNNEKNHIFIFDSGIGFYSDWFRVLKIILATINAKWIHPSLALRLLKANLGSLESSCEIMEFALRQPLREKVEPIIAARPDLLGLSVSIWNHRATVELLLALEHAWAENPQNALAAQKPIVVLGGPEVSWLPPEAEIFRHADYVIRGEGEESFSELCFDALKKKREETISKNVIFINSGDTIVELDKLVSAYSLYTNEDLKRKLVYVEASRGCPFACEFCQAAKNTSGSQQVREFPLEPFLAEMGTLIDRGARTFKFLDRTFNLDINRAKRVMEFFLERIIAHNNSEAKSPRSEKPICVHFEMVPSRFPDELKELIRRFPPGTLRLELGVQTFNTETRRLVKLSGDMAKELETLAFLRRESGAIVHADLIAGLPGEDFVSFGDGFDRLWKLISLKPSGGTELPFNAIFEIQLGILKCLPGTPITRHNETHGMSYSDEPPYEVIETKALSRAELERIKNFSRFWELIVNRNSFPDLLQGFLIPEEPVFKKFMELSGSLLEHFGRNWGIDQNDLRLYLKTLLAGN